MEANNLSEILDYKFALALAIVICLIPVWTVIGLIYVYGFLNLNEESIDSLLDIFLFFVDLLYSYIILMLGWVIHTRFGKFRLARLIYFLAFVNVISALFFESDRDFMTTIDVVWITITALLNFVFVFVLEKSKVHLYGLRILYGVTFTGTIGLFALDAILKNTVPNIDIYLLPTIGVASFLGLINLIVLVFIFYRAMRDKVLGEIIRHP